MAADHEQIEQSIKNVEGLTERVVRLTGGAIEQVNEALDYDIYSLEALLKLRVASVEATLIRAVATLFERATFHTLKAYFHASPALQAILAAIWAAVMVVWGVVKTIIAIVQVIQSLKIDDLLANIWPWFKEARDKFRKLVGDLSEAIGWGADGLLHLLHAGQGFTDVIGGIFGKSWAWMEVEWMEKTGSVLEKTAMYADKIRDNPGDILETIFQGEMKDSFNKVFYWGDQLTRKIDGGLDKATSALTGLVSVADELSAIQEGMPEVIRKNIPAEIWSALEGFSETVTEQILPRIYTAERQINSLQYLFAAGSGKISDLADQLKHPGQVLLGVDDLPDYARLTEQWAIDNVAGRLLNDNADQDRSILQPFLDEFELIDNAAQSPLPVLEFMTIESPTRAALHGIVAEPQETWFIDGYDDQH